MDKAQIASLKWITDILKKRHIPFQISGGLAAIAYGATRPLVDIDIDIPDDRFADILNDVSPYMIYGLERYQSDHWDLYLLTLHYRGQDIDLSGAHTTKIFNKQACAWHLLKTHFENVALKNIFGLNLPVIDKNDLIEYKSMLARDVDLMDVREITRCKK